LTPVSAIAGASRDPEVSCMQSFRRSFLPGSGAAGFASPRSYGAFAARVQIGIESPRWPLAPLAGVAPGVVAAIWTAMSVGLRSAAALAFVASRRAPSAGLIEPRIPSPADD